VPTNKQQGPQVVLKSIESDVTLAEKTRALKDKEFNAKSVFNILNKDFFKKP